MVEEREDEIERLYYDGRVHRWSRKGSRKGSVWPGHTTFVALKGGAVVVGDRYAGEGVERTYACDPASLLEGCFQDLVAQQLGPRVLEELLAEVRHELGVVLGASAPASVPASVPASAMAASKVVSAPSKPRPAAAAAAATASERSSTPPSAAVSTPGPSTPAPTSSAHVDLTVVACPSVGLPLAVALRGITRTSVHELLGRLRSLPFRAAAGVPRERAEGLATRLAELGAEVRLVPAGGS